MNEIYRKSKVVKTYSLIIIETAGTLFSYLLALLLRFGNFELDGYRSTYILYGGILLAIGMIYSTMTDWNRDFFERGYYREFIAVSKYTVMITLFGVIGLYLGHAIYDLSRLVFGYFFLINTVVLYSLHLLFKEFMLKHYRKSINSDKLMVITQADQAEKVVKRIQEWKHWNYELTSVAIVDRDMTGEKISGVPVVCGREDLIEKSTTEIIDRVFISLPRDDMEFVKEIILEFEAMGVLCHYNIELEELNLEGKEAGNFAGFSVVSFSLQNLDYRRLLIKRFTDIVGSIVGLLITAILFPFVALAIKIDSRGPVFFAQERIGRNGRHFKLYKFRSMYVNAQDGLKELMKNNEMEGPMFKMENDPRITKVGKFIRRTSIDELPQFWNVLKGDMSLVGTRPPTIAEFEQYNPHYRRRLSITPGLTGLWQVSGRSDIKDFDEVVRLDLEYIDQWSLLLDVKLLIQTVGVVLTGKGSK